jgi:hypothetical protein
MKLAHPVPDGLWMHVQLGRHRPPVAEVAEPCRQRLDETLAGRRRLIVQRCQHTAAQGGEQSRVAVHENCVEVLVGEDRVVVEQAAALQLRRGLGDEHARRQVFEKDRVTYDRAGPAQRPYQPAPPAGPVRIGDDRADQIPPTHGQAGTVQPGQERLADGIVRVDEDHGRLRRQGPSRAHRGAPNSDEVGAAREQQVDQLLTPAFTLRHRLRLLPHVSPGGGRGQLVDEDEDRFRESGQGGGLDPELEGGLRDVTPRDPPAHLIRGEQ